MREYIFRGKCGSKWHYGDLYTQSYTPQIIAYNKHHDKMDTAFVDPETVGQYTGLTDKNGVKIFEGDVVKSDNGTMAAAVFVVCYGVCRPKMYRRLLKNYYRMEPRCMDFGLFGRSVKTGEDVILTDATQLFEVIGNIHDNPELLKEGGGE